MSDVIAIIVNISFGLACAAVPAYFGWKNKLYHFSVMGIIVCIAIIFFPYGMALSALCAGLFYLMIRKEVKTREDLARRKRVKEAERKLADDGEDPNEEFRATINKDSVWPPVLIDSLNNDEDEEKAE